MLSIPVVLAAAYVAVLVVRFPDLIRWISGDADYASAFILPQAIAHGHTGQVVLSTQGAWLSLWYGLATAGLSFHRVLWELSPALLALASACVIGWATARVATRTAGVLATALIVAASPVALASFTSPWAHNTTMLGAALLGGFLVWLHTTDRRPAVIAAIATLLSLVIGTCLASDALLWTEGLIPCLVVLLLLALIGSDRRRLYAMAGVAAGSFLVATVTSSVMRSLGFVTAPPPLQIDFSRIGVHLWWLVRGLLRLGNGATIAPQASLRLPLTLAAAVVTICALCATLRFAAGRITNPGVGRERARTVHALFWSTSLLCTACAYVLTAEVPSDQYIVVAVLAVSATLPLLASSRRGSRLVAAGAAVFIAAGIVALAAGDSRYVNPRAITPSQTSRIEAVVLERHLGIGYAGYWDAAPLDWFSHGRLRVYPLTEVPGHTEPMGIARIAAWYRPLPDTPSYLLLAPDDNVLPDRVPSDLPTPAHEYRVGQFTLATYPYDIAADLHAPVN